MKYPKVRPTSRVVLESLVAQLRPRLPDARVLDLFAGTGSVGLAMYENGAAEVVFVEGERSLAQQLRARLPQGCELVIGRLPRALERVEGIFDLVLADPPYNTDFGRGCLQKLAPLLKREALVLVEHHHKEDYPEEIGDLILEKRKRFGETAISYYRSGI